MTRAQNGDHEAFHMLFKDIRPSITRSFRRQLPDISEVENISQEVLVAMCKWHHTYQPERPFQPWLFPITRKITGKYLRRKQDHSAVQAQTDELQELHIEDSSGPELELREALEQLSPTQIEALDLTKLLGLSVAEAARRMGQASVQ